MSIPPVKQPLRCRYGCSQSLVTRSNTMPSDIISSGMSSPQSSQSYQNIAGYHQFAKNGHPQARRDRINNPIYAGTPKSHNPSAHLPSPSQRANCHIKRANIRQLEPMHIQIHSRVLRNSSTKSWSTSSLASFQLAYCNLEKNKNN